MELVTQTGILTPLRAALLAREEAPSAAPVRVRNRLMTAVQKQCDLLAQTPEGRSALTAAAAADHDPLLRLIAATTIQRWDVEGARATLEDLVTRSGGTVVRPMTMTAALAVREGPGLAAALCLLNVDVPRRSAREAPEVSTAPVASELLDAAERVYNLAMNGGIDHAYEVVGEQFPAAADACDALGAHGEAVVLREVVALVGSLDATRKGRAAALRALSPRKDREIQALYERFCARDDLLDRLEAATEA